MYVLPANNHGQPINFANPKQQFAAVPKEEFISSKITIAASLFENVFGHSAATKALPALVAISALGHLLGIAFTVRK
jgi:hypothetical protein